MKEAMLDYFLMHTKHTCREAIAIDATTIRKKLRLAESQFTPHLYSNLSIKRHKCFRGNIPAELLPHAGLLNLHPIVLAIV